MEDSEKDDWQGKAPADVSWRTRLYAKVIAQSVDFHSISEASLAAAPEPRLELSFIRYPLSSSLHPPSSILVLRPSKRQQLSMCIC